MRIRGVLPLLGVAVLVVGMPSPVSARGSGAGTSGCGRPASPGTTEQHVTVAGVARDYLLSIPATYDGSKRVPLLFDFHGLGSEMQQQFVYSQLGPQGGARGYVVITPNGRGDALRRWSLVRSATANRDVQFVVAMLAAARKVLCIDAARVYATGMSNGAMFSIVVACALPGRFAAIAPVAGVNGAAACRTRASRISVLAFHGTADPIVPYQGGDYFTGAQASHRAPREAAPVDDAVAAWAALDRCAKAPKQTVVAGDVQRVTYTGCAPGTAVGLYRVVGEGHTWPGAIPVMEARLGATTGSIHATALILDFFDTHRRPT